MVGTLSIIFSAKTLGFRTILIALPVENPESLTTFFIEGKSAVSKCCSEDFGSPGRIRTSNISVNSQRSDFVKIAGAKLNQRKLTNCSEIQRVTSSVFVHLLFGFFCHHSPQLILRLYYVSSRPSAVGKLRRTVADQPRVDWFGQHWRFCVLGTGAGDRNRNKSELA